MMGSLFNKWHQCHWSPIDKKLTLNLNVTPNTKTNSKWTTGTNIKLNTFKLLKENIGEKSSGHEVCEQFLNMILKAGSIKEKNQ